MFKYGMILLYGLLNIDNNPQEGVSWLNHAAKQEGEGCMNALHELGILYEGKGNELGLFAPVFFIIII